MPPSFFRNAYRTIPPLREAYSCHCGDTSPLQMVLSYHLHATGGRRAELLKNPAYTAVLDQYK